MLFNILKSSILILLFSLVSFTKLHAQNLGGGWVIGANFSQVDGDAQAGYNQVGLSTGAYVVFQLNDWLQVQPEMLYDQLGARSKDGFLNTRFNYISFPMLVNFSIPIDLGDQTRDISLQAGPVFGFVMSVKDQLFRSNETSNYRTLDLRYALGANFELSSDLSFNARFQYSARAMAKGIQAGFGSGPFHNYVQASLRWNFIQ